VTATLPVVGTVAGTLSGTVSVSGSVPVSVSGSVTVLPRVGHPPQHGPHFIEQRQYLLSGGAGHRLGPGQQLQVHRKLPG